MVPPEGGARQVAKAAGRLRGLRGAARSKT
jgi:hypothetical protein